MNLKGDIMNKLNVMSDWETVKYILDHKCSVSRFGDGELEVMIGFNIPFQKSNHQIRKKLKQIKTTDKCLVCLSDVFNKERFNKDLINEYDYKFWKKISFFQKPFYVHYFKNNKILGDTFVSRFYLRFKDHSKTPEYIKYIKQIWEKRNILFVEGEQTRLGVGNDFFSNAKSIRRILCPGKNAFDKYEEIKKAIEDNAKSDDLVICALGPTATILAFELSSKMQILDLGHIDIEYEWFLRKATKKIPIEHKYVNECGKEGRNPSECDDKTYLSQIIQKIE